VSYNRRMARCYNRVQRLFAHIPTTTTTTTTTTTRRSVPERPAVQTPERRRRASAARDAPRRRPSWRRRCAPPRAPRAALCRPHLSSSSSLWVCEREREREREHTANIIDALPLTKARARCTEPESLPRRAAEPMRLYASYTSS
jgi:hypothetical protein